MKPTETQYITIIHGDDGFTSVHAYTTVKNALTKARDYVAQIRFNNLDGYSREVSQFGQVIEVMSVKQFRERCAFGLIPEHEFCLGY